MTRGPWQVRYTRRAEKDLGRLDPPIRRRVIRAFDDLAVGEATGVVRLQGAEATYRLRVGDWRVIFRRDGEDLLILVVSNPAAGPCLRSLAR